MPTALHAVFRPANRVFGPLHAACVVTPQVVPLQHAPVVGGAHGSVGVQAVPRPWNVPPWLFTQSLWQLLKQNVPKQQAPAFVVHAPGEVHVVFNPVNVPPRPPFTGSVHRRLAPAAPGCSEQIWQPLLFGGT